MVRRTVEATAPENLPPSAVIARQIEADLKKAIREIAAVARSLEAGPTDETDGQLALDI